MLLDWFENIYYNMNMSNGCFFVKDNTWLKLRTSLYYSQLSLPCHHLKHWLSTRYASIPTGRFPLAWKWCMACASLIDLGFISQTVLSFTPNPAEIIVSFIWKWLSQLISDMCMFAGLIHLFINIRPVPPFTKGIKNGCPCIVEISTMHGQPFLIPFITWNIK